MSLSFSLWLYHMHYHLIMMIIQTYEHSSHYYYCKLINNIILMSNHFRSVSYLRLVDTKEIQQHLEKSRLTFVLQSFLTWFFQSLEMMINPSLDGSMTANPLRSSDRYMTLLPYNTYTSNCNRLFFFSLQKIKMMAEPADAVTEIKVFQFSGISIIRINSLGLKTMHSPNKDADWFKYMRENKV